MTAGVRDLPQGRRGQLVALGLLLAAIGVVWLVIAEPLLGWYSARAEQLAEQRLVLARAVRLVDMLPQLRREVGRAGVGAAAVAPATLLAGDTDAIAGATLQGAVQDMAAAAGATLASTEVLPGEQQGAFRRISLRVALSSTPWKALVALLRAIDEAQLRLLVDDLQLHVIAQPNAAGTGPIDASLVVLGFRAGGEGRATASLAAPLP